MKHKNILAISGSLRQHSYNSAALQALSYLAPAQINIRIYSQMDQLPLFNPDLEDQPIPALQNLRNALSGADALIIASPEYAHGISGPMKNTLDWLVSGEEFVNMPVMLVNTSPRATHAQASLREVITTMSGNIIESACVAIPLLGSELDCQGIIDQPQIAAALRHALDKLYCELKELD
ncbi:NADPH-dependent FMN reductase [Neptunicella sp. SCSIO 80796]|uniref:NADPH-dependent FMN reductase n=1 Tax=Neptunicella plasticusilytica TaxID=3117012 RepID=UPI003A4E1364